MKKVNLSNLDIIGGVTTGNSVSPDFYDENSIDLGYERHVQSTHYQCVDCGTYWSEDEASDEKCIDCNSDNVNEVDGQEIDHFDFDGYCSETFLYGSWKKNDDGKYGPDETGEYAAIYDINDNHIQVVWSKFALKCYQCSPCYPNQRVFQGDLDAAGENWTYCLPAEWMNDEWREEFEKHMVERYIK